jgi:RNA polymerase sigma-70 factor (ECF subfamily)
VSYDQTDEQIVARVLAGEIEQFETIVRRHSARLYRVALSMLRDDAEAEDVVQDTLLSAFQHLRQFAGRARFSTWLVRIAVRQSWAHSARCARQVPVDSEQELFRTLPAAAPDPEQHLSTREMTGLLKVAMGGLPETYRRVLMLRDLDEMDTFDTAQHLRISQVNVKVRLCRARVMLRREIEALMVPAGSPEQLGATA